MLVINTHNFGRFWYISCTITQHFGGPTTVSTIDDPRVRLRVIRCQHSQVWPILTHFVDYYSPFLGSQSGFHGC